MDRLIMIGSVYEHYKDVFNTFEIENNAGINEVYDQVDHMMKEEI